MMSVFLPQWATCRGNLRSAGISRFFARPLRLSSSHHLRRGLPTASFYIGCGTRVLPLRLTSPRAPCSSLAWLTANRCVARCCLRPRGVGVALVSNVPAAWPAPVEKGSARSQNLLVLGATCQIQGYTLHLASLAYQSCRLRDASLHYRAVD